MIYGYVTEPWPHQRQCFEFAYNKQAVGIFMDMGTGKSKVAIDLIVNRGHQKTLIVCPARVINVWPKQFKLHAPANINVVPLKVGTGKKRASVIKNYKGPYPVVFVTNYEIIWRSPMNNILLKSGFDCVVLDESHRAKRPGGKASRFLHRLGKITPWKMILTGTPLAHSPLDIYGQYRFLDQSIFGTNFAEFQQKYAVMGGPENRLVLRYINQEELSQKMFSIGFRVLAKDVMQLPEPIELEYEVELPPFLMNIYEEVRKESVLETINGPKALNNTLIQLTRMQQLTSGIIPDGEGGIMRIDDSKAKMLADILEDLSPDEPIVIFARFTDDLDRIKEVCEHAGRSYAEVSGRADELIDWQEGRRNVVGVQIQSGSEGEDYTRARYTIYYSLGTSLKDYNQSRKRTDRPGQVDNPVFIHLIAKKTVDRKTIKALQSGQEVVEYVYNAWKNGEVTDE